MNGFLNEKQMLKFAKKTKVSLFELDQIVKYMYQCDCERQPKTYKDYYKLMKENWSSYFSFYTILEGAWNIISKEIYGIGIDKKTWFSNVVRLERFEDYQVFKKDKIEKEYITDNDLILRHLKKEGIGIFFYQIFDSNGKSFYIGYKIPKFSNFLNKKEENFWLKKLEEWYLD